MTLYEDIIQPILDIQNINPETWGEPIKLPRDKEWVISFSKTLEKSQGTKQGRIEDNLWEENIRTHFSNKLPTDLVTI